MSGEYTYPVRIACFNAGESWSRDATSDVADAVAQRLADTDTEIPPALRAFIEANATRSIDLQLALPLRIAPEVRTSAQRQANLPVTGRWRFRDTAMQLTLSPPRQVGNAIRFAYSRLPAYLIRQ